MSALTKEQLNLIFPLSKLRIDNFFAPFTEGMDKFEINTPLRMSAFIAQIGVESGCFFYVKEIASGGEYEGRKDLGNTEAGDGKRFKGRGLIQLTGRANYAQCAKELGIDCISHPEILETPEKACLVAGWFWAKHNLNILADKGDLKAITQKINGGQNGWAKREEFYNKAKKVLGA